ncbi:hypothetical protein GEMRC1_004259 [Eukaryota sp. GEM-RC1]
MLQVDYQPHKLKLHVLFRVIFVLIVLFTQMFELRLMLPQFVIFGLLSRSATVVAFYLCCRNPGIVTASNQRSLTEIVHDSSLHNSSYYCYSCAVYKVGRSKHCKRCSCCITNHDHHCFWLGCIGAANMGYFLILLTSLCIHFATVVAIGLFTLITLKSQFNQLQPTFIRKSSFTLAANISSLKNALIAYLVLSIVLFLVFFIYYVYHLRLIKLGQTLSQHHKSKILLNVASKNKRLVHAWEKRRRLNPSLPAHDPLWPCCKRPESCCCPVCVVQSSDKLTLDNGLGFWKNLGAVFIRQSLVNDVLRSC